MSIVELMTLVVFYRIIMFDTYTILTASEDTYTLSEGCAIQSGRICTLSEGIGTLSERSCYKSESS